MKKYFVTLDARLNIPHSEMDRLEREVESFLRSPGLVFVMPPGSQVVVVEPDVLYMPSPPKLEKHP